MAIVLDKHNEIKTDYFDFIEALEDLENGLRCCLDIDMFDYVYGQSEIKEVNELKLIPLEQFSCNRTIIGNNGTRINLKSSFGLIQKDFINIDFQNVELIDKSDYKMKGIFINKQNDYFDIVNELAKYLEIVGADNTNSFILNEFDLSEIQLLPFRLCYNDGNFVVSDIESIMATKEYDSIVDNLYCSDYAL